MIPTNSQSNISRTEIDTSALSIIKGRMEPHIYAFRIESFPPSYKIGDTFRETEVRIDEWRKIYSELELTHNADWEWSAMVGDRFFRDHAVHKYLEEEKGRTAMEEKDFGHHHISSEFYLDTEIEEIEEAVDKIRTSAALPVSPYKFYSAATLKKEEKGFRRDKDYRLRDNQEKVVESFLTAYNNGHRTMLMYAVMRFGKTFTALFCAKAINAKTIMVVSAKADVSSEWKKNVQSIIALDKFEFFDKTNLRTLNIDKEVDKGNTVVLFLTLQDLQGSKIKEKHKNIFDPERVWDMLIVDESHFGARAPRYGIPLRDTEIKDAEEDRESKYESPEKLDEELKKLNRNVTLHLSGTPYRILMSNEFDNDDMIACIRYPDIIKARDKWFESHIDSDASDKSEYEEWDNPYFGFPQMIRFAFNLNQESLRVIKNMEDEGGSIKFSELFNPKNRTKDNKTFRHRQFVHSNEVLSFLQTIDGTKDDENVLGFLDNERIKNGKLCNHIVMVLPFKASCDAMKTLIEANRDKFKNLCDYTVINIAGLDSKDNIQTLAGKISSCEANGEITLSLTVRKMLTGVTVPEWDTMIYLKETFSPEEYDQAVFRLQNRFIKTYKNPDGSIVKYDMKPQTILVDFDPQRMFRLQEQKCLVYSSTHQLRDTKELKEFITDELTSSPIISLDHHKLRQIDAADLMDEIRKYSQSRGIPEEAETIPIDKSLLENEEILKAIAHLCPIDSKKGLTKKANASDGNGDDADPQKGESDGNDQDSEDKGDSQSKKKKMENNLAKQLASYHSLILYFAFLSTDRLTSIQDIISRIDTEDNSRIASHLGIEKNILRLFASSDPWTLFKLNKSINDTNYTGNRPDLSHDEMVNVILKRCNRLSESEIITPPEIADEMVALLPEDLFEQEGIVLDIASKQGEFAVALKKRYGDKYPEACRTRIYSLCTSGLAYEFTRKTYRHLGFDINNIVRGKTSFGIIADKLKDKKKGKFLTVKEIFGKDMIINTVVGNPPYQVMDGGGAATSAISIYNLFVDASKETNTRYINMIMPARWYSGGKGLDEFRQQNLQDPHYKEIFDFPNPKDCFPLANISGGVCYFLYDKKHRGDCLFTNVVNGIKESARRRLNEYEIFIRYNNALSIIRKVNNPPDSFIKLVSARNPFGLHSSVRGITSPTPDKNITVYSSKGIGYVSLKEINDKSSLVNTHKVLMGKVLSGHIGETDENGQVKVIASLQLAKPNQVSTDSYLVIGPFKNNEESSNALKYLRTKFVRFLLLQSLASMNISRANFRFVPLQDFSSNEDIDWSRSVEEIDAQLYAKYNLSDKEIAFIESMIKPM